MRIRSVRLWLPLVLVLSLTVAAYLLWRPTSNSLTAGGVEWAMEGSNPARTRAQDASLSLPMTDRREISVLEDDGEGSPLAVVGNTALVEADGHLRAVDLRSGKERWSFPVTGAYVSPASDGERVYVRVERDNKGQVFALDLATGEQKWAFIPRRLSSEETDFWGGHLTSPVVQNDLVYIGAGKELYALNAETGTVEWEHGAQDYILSSAAVAEGSVYISDAKFVYAVDAQTGQQRWRFSVTFAVYFAPVVAEGKVFVRSGETIVALSASDGAVHWQAPFSGQATIPGAVRDGRLFVTSGVALHALDTETGRKLWSYNQPNYVSLPAVAGDKVFVLTGARGQTRLAALDVATGKETWTEKVGNLAGAAPVIAGDILYVRTTDGRVLSFSG